jgi:hypothetical protein
MNFPARGNLLCFLAFPVAFGTLATIRIDAARIANDEPLEGVLQRRFDDPGARLAEVDDPKFVGAATIESALGYQLRRARVAADDERNLKTITRAS